MNYILVAIIICGVLYIGLKFIRGKKEQSFIGTILMAGIGFISQATGNWQDTLVAFGTEILPIWVKGFL